MTRTFLHFKSQGTEKVNQGTDDVQNLKTETSVVADSDHIHGVP